MSNLINQLNLALNLHRSGQLQAAEQHYQQIVAQEPHQAKVWYLLGLVAHQMNQLELAVQRYRHSLTLQPNAVEVHNNLGAALQQQGHLNQAMTHYHAILRLNPHNPQAQVNLGVVLQQQGQVMAAIARYRKALQLQPTLLEAHTNLAHALKQWGDIDAALEHYRAAVNLAPGQPEPYQHLGDCLQEEGQIEAAIAVYEQALTQFPDHVHLRGSQIRAYLSSGDLLRGFAAYDPWRLGLSQQPLQPTWDGSALQGQPIVLYTEPGSGFGDAIQFVRYAPLVANQGGQVIVQCPAALQDLFRTVEGVTAVIGPEEPLPDGTLQASLLSLPRLFATTLDTIPAAVPYLRPLSRPLLEPMGQNSKSHLKVGLVWSGDPNHHHDHERSCPLSAFSAFIPHPEVGFYSLQKGQRQADLAQFDLGPISDMSHHLHSFADTASVIAQLDLVISVDTAVAHLAGALGKPVWILLAYSADWRWLRGRTDSPWYPTVRLFRQPRRQDWAAVVAEVAIALAAFKRSYDTKGGSSVAASGS